MDQADAGVDPQDVLAAINSAIPADPGPLPAPEPLAELPPEEAPQYSAEPAIHRPASSRALQAPSVWSRHRHEAAGLVTAFVAIVWLASAFAAGSWGAALIGLLFAGGAASIRAYAPVETT